MRDVDNGEDWMWEQGYVGKNLYLLLSFAVNLKLLSKFITLKKNVLYMKSYRRLLPRPPPSGSIFLVSRSKHDASFKYGMIFKD